MQELTIVDVAEIANVSVSTVSRVLNNHPDVSRTTSEKVMKVIHENGYVPNNSARNLKHKSMKAVAVIVKGFTNPVFTTMLKIIQRELEKNNYTMLLSAIEIYQDEVDAAVSLYKEKKPRGIIFMGGNFSHSQNNLSLLRIPFIMLTITLNDIDKNSYSSVTVDDYLCGYNTAKHIIENGHHDIALIGSRENDISVASLRISGFKQLLKEKQIPDSSLHLAYAGDYTYEAGYEATLKLLEESKFTCLFCISDILALGALRALYEKGYKVPEDVSVIGFDGIQEGRFSVPSLATMKQPFTQMANKSVEILLDKIRSNQPHKHKFYETVFLEGESFRSLL